MLYFAYGSNLNLRQMQHRCPDAVPLDKYMLRGARLVFRGVADVISDEGGTAPGGLWRITPDCEARLDRYEGYRPDDPDGGMYSKEILLLDDLPDGETELMLYTMNSTGIYPPSEGYYSGIVDGYRDFGLPLAPLRLALKHSHDAKHPSHVERRRTRRMGRPALAPRPVPKVTVHVAPDKATRKAQKLAAQKAERNSPAAKRNRSKQKQPDLWGASTPAAVRNRKVMNLDQWLADKYNNGERY
jgi:gamma-glutamylcyclotransferase